jgi:polar amino acid transport system substrate-binding protein
MSTRVSARAAALLALLLTASTDGAWAQSSARAQSSAAAQSCTPGQLSTRFPGFAGHVLRVAVDPNEPPMMYRDPADPGVITGFNADLVREVAKCLGATVEFEVLSFNGLVAAVVAGRADLQFTGMYYLPARAAMVDYVNYLRGITGTLVVKGAGARFKTLADVCGVRGGVMTGAIDEVILRDQSARCEGAGRAPVDISTYPDTAALVRAVQNHRIDLCLIGQQVVSEQVKLHPDTLDHAFVLQTDLKIGASMAKSRVALRDAVFGALQFLQQSGAETALLQRHGLDPAMQLPVEMRSN